MAENKRDSIFLGYEDGTGEEILITPSHLVVTGVTQHSGKTTTLEALITRYTSRKIVFISKPGEKVFERPYLKDINNPKPLLEVNTDYAFLRSLIEAHSKEKLNIEKGTLMNLCKGADSLDEILINIREKLPKARGLNGEILTRLEHYLNELIERMNEYEFAYNLGTYHKFAVNKVDVSKHPDEIQSLVIASTVRRVLDELSETIVVIPEAWKFLPQGYNNPSKRAVESFIRQGAANGNFLWVDSQDITGVDKTVLKQVSTWLLGYQAEKNEVEHTIKQIPLPKKSLPKAEDIMNLGMGEFYLVQPGNVRKVYVCPVWMHNEAARSIAKGEITIDEIGKPADGSSKVFRGIDEEAKRGGGEAVKFRNGSEIHFDSEKAGKFRGATVEYYAEPSWVRERIEQCGGSDKKDEASGKMFMLDKERSYLYEKFLELLDRKLMEAFSVFILNENQDRIDVGFDPARATVNIDEKLIERKIKEMMPDGPGSVVYEVEPLEKIKKDFLQEAKDKILADVDGLSDRGKKILKFVESVGQGCNQTFIIEKLFHLSATSGGTRGWVSKECKGVASVGLLRKDKNSVMYPNLKDRINELLEVHHAKPDEVNNLYNHILNELI